MTRPMLHLLLRSCRELRDTVALLAVIALIGITAPRLTAAENATADESAFFASASAPEFSPSGVVIPPRPAWVSAVPQSGDRTIVVNSGPFVSREECRKQLELEIDRAIDRHVETMFGSDRIGRLLQRERAKLREELTAKTYEETIQVSVGPMKQIHAQLEFTDAFQVHAADLWRKYRMLGRLVSFAIAAVSVLALPVVALIYHNAASASNGPLVARRLQFSAAATILLIVSAGAIASAWWSRIY